MPFPFEVDFEEVESDLDTYVDAVFGALESDFLGEGAATPNRVAH